MLRKFACRGAHQEEKQKYVQTHTSKSQNTEKHTEKANPDFIGSLVYVNITSGKV